MKSAFSNPKDWILHCIRSNLYFASCCDTGFEKDETYSPVSFHRLAGQGNSGVRLPASGLPSQGAQLRLGETRTSRRPLQVNQEG